MKTISSVVENYIKSKPFLLNSLAQGIINLTSLARIMVAVFAIGLIGYLLDQIMLLLQRSVSWDKGAVIR